ncbi:uncharacterized protein DS421_15g501920 [Arachis hypogaea]|nr:uncharacterized protein DS421_15g501920 [Arachis hypogaea]
MVTVVRAPRPTPKRRASTTERMSFDGEARRGRPSILMVVEESSTARSKRISDVVIFSFQHIQQ